MSLNWDTTKIKNADELMYRTALKDHRATGEVKGRQYMKATSHTLIMITMVLGIPQITETTLEEFWARLQFAQALHGQYVTDHEGKDLLTYEVVKAHIGLSTNASRRTRAEFVKTLSTNFLEDRLRHARRREQLAKIAMEDNAALTEG